MIRGFQFHFSPCSQTKTVCPHFPYINPPPLHTKQLKYATLLTYLYDAYYFQNQQRELTVRHAKEQDKEMKKRLDVQKEEYEATIKRHLSFIDQVNTLQNCSFHKFYEWGIWSMCVCIRTGRRHKKSEVNSPPNKQDFQNLRGEN